MGNFAMGEISLICVQKKKRRIVQLSSKSSKNNRSFQGIFKKKKKIIFFRPSQKNAPKNQLVVAYLAKNFSLDCVGDKALTCKPTLCQRGSAASWPVEVH